jgi:hypothetical protein
VHGTKGWSNCVSPSSCVPTEDRAWNTQVLEFPPSSEGKLRAFLWPWFFFVFFLSLLLFESAKLRLLTQESAKLRLLIQLTLRKSTQNLHWQVSELWVEFTNFPKKLVWLLRYWGTEEQWEQGYWGGSWGPGVLSLHCPLLHRHLHLSFLRKPFFSLAWGS